MSAYWKSSQRVARKVLSPDDTRGLVEAMGDVQNALADIPASEIKTFAYKATDENTTVQTRVLRPQFVSVNARSADSPSSTVTATGIHWCLGAEPGQIIVTRIAGLVTDEDYEVTLKIEGAV